MDNIRELYQQIILDHNQNPQNYHAMESASHHAEGNNPLCGDQITIYLDVEENRIADISFTGSGCAISTASASIMTTVLKGKTLPEVQEIFEAFHEMATTGKTARNNMGKLEVMAGVYKFPVRVKCAVLAWHTTMSALKGQEETVTTE